MMRLTTLWKVDGEIDVDGRSRIANELAQAWPHDAPPRFFRSSTNFVYGFRRAGAPHFLRFAHDSERSREQIAAELELLSRLRSAGLPVAEPVAASAGEFVVSAETRLGRFHAVAFRRANGNQLQAKELDADHLRRWGATLGRLHAHLKNDQSLPALARPSWQDDLRLVEGQLPAEVAVEREFAAIDSALRELPTTSDSYGLIHGDFQLDNLFWNGQIEIIDFDDCRYHWYLADIADAADDLPRDSAGSNWLGAFLAGYQEECALAEDLLSQQLGLFRRAARLCRYARVRRALDLALEPDHPPWLRRLHATLLSDVNAYERTIAHEYRGGNNGARHRPEQRAVGLPFASGRQEDQG